MNMEIVDINSPEAKSEDVVAENIRRLGDLFPELLTEGPAGPSVNIDVLKQLVGDSSLSDADEKYGLSWFGKRNARKMALTPSLGTLLPRPEESEDWDNTKNLIIEGDNLEVLKLLQKSYSGKVKLIYIDPPYNTGKDFVYPDNYQDNIKNYLELTGQTEEGCKTTSNTDSNGRFHADWLNMMYPRLKLARNLLADDGVIFISIDDNEISSLKSLLAEVFGSEGFLNTFVWVSNLKGRQISGSGAAATKEYMLAFAKNINQQESFSVRASRMKELMPGVYKGFDYEVREDAYGSYVVKNELYNSNSIFNEKTRPNLVFNIFYNPENGEVRTASIEQDAIPGFVKISPHQNSSKGYRYHAWRWSAAKVVEDSKDLEFLTTQSGYKVYTKVRDVDSTTMKDLIMDISTSTGSRDLENLGFETSVFHFPKPVSLISVLVDSLSTGEGIILDFFAGSGTTGQAVMEQNALDGGNRQFILVQLPEPLLEENKEQAAALAFCKEHNLEENIAALTAERLRRAGAKVRSENPMFAGDVGFRVFKLAESNIRAWNPLTEDLEGTLRTSEDHLVEGRSALDVLYEILLKRGLDLCIPIETKEIAGHHVNAVGGGVLFACLDSRIAQANVEALAEGIVAWREELGVVGDVNCIFRDSAFDNDVAKSNMSSILEQAGFTKIQSL